MNNERGVVLIVTLLVVAILTVIVLEFFNTAYVDLSIAGNFRDDLKREYLARAGIDGAKLALLADIKAGNKYDAGNEDWANPFFFPVADGWVNVSITDEERKINLNRLNSIYLQETLRILFERLEIDPLLVDGIVDWIDTDDEPVSTDGAESDYYLYQEPPYSAKNGEMDTVEELLLVKGITPEIFVRLKPHITVHSNEKININTVSNEILQCVLETMENIERVDPDNSNETVEDYLDSNYNVQDIVAEIVKYRDETPFEDIDNITRSQGNINGIIGLNKFRTLLTVKSEYFTIKSSGIIGELESVEQVIVKRNSINNNIKIINWR